MTETRRYWLTAINRVNTELLNNAKICADKGDFPSAAMNLAGVLGLREMAAYMGLATKPDQALVKSIRAFWRQHQPVDIEMQIEKCDVMGDLNKIFSVVGDEDGSD